MNTRYTNKGYSRQLKQHRDIILSLGERYRNPINGRVEWGRAFAAEPDLANLLLVGEGDRATQMKRLSNVWLHLKPKTDPEDKSGHSTFKGAPALCWVFDQHRQAIEALAHANIGQTGRVQWAVALENSPDVAKLLGYDSRDAEGKRKFINVLGFWYRVRGKRKTIASPSKLPKQVAAGANPNGPALPPPTPQPKRVGPQFCSRCGHALGVELVAGDVVSALAASGMAPEQIVLTLTRAAATVARLSTGGHPSTTNES